MILWPIVFYFHGLYQLRRGRSRIDEAVTVVIAVVLGTILLAFFILFFRPTVPRADGTLEVFTFSRAFLGLFALLDVALVVLSRNLLRQELRRARLRLEKLQRILVLGAGALGKEVTKKLLDHREMGLPGRWVFSMTIPARRVGEF